jgi:hypothetical protein
MGNVREQSRQRLARCSYDESRLPCSFCCDSSSILRVGKKIFMCSEVVTKTHEGKEEEKEKRPLCAHTLVFDFSFQSISFLTRV